MVQRTVITHSDGATVGVTSGTEYEREQATVEDAQFNRERMRQKLENGLSVLEGHDADWDTYDTAQKVLVLRHLLKGMIWIIRMQLGQLESEGPASP